MPKDLEILNLFAVLSLIYLSRLLLDNRLPCFEIKWSEISLFAASEASPVA